MSHLTTTLTLSEDLPILIGTSTARPAAAAAFVRFGDPGDPGVAVLFPDLETLNRLISVLATLHRQMLSAQTIAAGGVRAFGPIVVGEHGAEVLRVVPDA